MADGAAPTKGTVTPLGAVFSPEETERAVARVEAAIADRRAELARLQGFVADNAALVSLLLRLPDDLSHDIMVPFGGAAFFPGRLIHTNELLVLLGEGYYAERSAKQAIEILHRRGKALEAQLEAMKATISDLEAEAKFFVSTAAESAEGLIEIREEYDEDAERTMSGSGVSSSSARDISDKDKEHARVMARLDELEKEEEEAGSSSADDDDEGAGTSEDDEDNEEEEDDVSADDEDHDASFGLSSSENAVTDQKDVTPALKSSLKQGNRDQMLKGAPLVPSVCKSQSKIIDSEVRVPTKAVSFQDDSKQPVSRDKYPPLPVDSKHSALRPEGSSDNAPAHGPKIISSGRKSFTGSIIEHDDNLPATQSSRTATSDKPSSSAASKPVSRFKMQKGGQ